jgi:hypothetical protein
MLTKSSGSFSGSFHDRTSHLQTPIVSAEGLAQRAEGILPSQHTCGAAHRTSLWVQVSPEHSLVDNDVKTPVTSMLLPGQTPGARTGQLTT